MHQANRPNTCSESSAFDFHSRLKSTFLSFSRLPILYHRKGNLMDGNPLYLVFRVATAERNTPLHHAFSLSKRKTLRHREIRENGSPVLTSQPTIPRLPPCAVLYRTGSEISRICRPQKRGRKIDREFIFSIFIREKHEDSIKQIIKKSVIYTLMLKLQSVCVLQCTFTIGNACTCSNVD